ncbi:MAG: FlgD immunoglobulin-like domain containing protein [bacterium]
MFKNIACVIVSLLIIYTVPVLGQKEATQEEQQAFQDVCDGKTMFPAWMVGNKTITIDGRIDEPQWDIANNIYVPGGWLYNESQSDTWRGFADLTGIVRVLYDSIAMYVSIISLDDNHITDEAGDPWFWQDGFELFMQPAYHDVAMHTYGGACWPFPKQGREYFLRIHRRFATDEGLFGENGDYEGDPCHNCPVRSDASDWNVSPCEEGSPELGFIRCAARELPEGHKWRDLWEGAWCAECEFPFKSPNFTEGWSNYGYSNPPQPGPNSKFKFNVLLNDDDDPGKTEDSRAAQYGLKRTCEGGWWGQGVNCHDYDDWGRNQFWLTMAYAGAKTTDNIAAMDAVKPELDKAFYPGYTMDNFDTVLARGYLPGDGILPYFKNRSKSSGILAVNTPNPFKPYTVINYSIPDARADFSIAVYDLNGNLIRNLAADARETKVKWDGMDLKGNAVPSGVYLYKITNGQHVFSSRMVLAR